MGKLVGGRLGIVTMAVALVCSVQAGSALAAGQGGSLQMYEATVTSEQFDELQSEGYDVVAPDPVPGGVAVDLVLSRAERAALSGRIDLELLRDENGLTARQRAARQAIGGYNVWRDYDGSDGLRRYLRGFVADNRQVAKQVVIGQTTQGRDIVAVRITKERGGSKTKLRDRPSVLYQGTTHAREWISTEVTRRLMEHFAGKSRQAKKLRKSRQLWFIPVLNPDGYQYTFDNERLWRKNLRDNDGDGEITNLDGVDLNRNYPEHWSYDNEGSEPEISSFTYRGPSAASEPETQASVAFVQKIDPVMALSYHSYGPLLLYPEGWQVQTPARDLPVYLALTGNDANPAVEGFDPDVSAELYTTNGEFTDWAHGEEGVLAWTPELEEGCEGCTFEFPDDEALVQREFEINVPFATDLARSAADPARPKSHLGNTTEPFHLDLTEFDPTFANNPLADFTFDQSNGDPQPVEILARNELRGVKLNYRINSGPVRTVKAPRWEGGETFGEGYDTYYGVRRGVVTGTDPGDSVKVWFTGKEKKHGKSAKRKRKRYGGVRSDSFTYEAKSESGAGTLVVAAEDYTGISPAQGTTAPSYLSYYTDALDANGYAHDVYDVDAEGREAPDALGVLGHYDAVIWYTGEDIITREPGMVGGTASRLANDEMLEMRAFMNEGGKVLYTGKYAGLQYQDAYEFDPVANEPCEVDAEVDARCQTLSSDFLQYYLGTYLFNEGGGLDPDTEEPYAVNGIIDPFADYDWALNGGDGAGNQDNANSFLTTSSLLPKDEFPQFASDAAAEWDDGIAGAFEPVDGSQYLYSNRADVSYKRLSRTLDLSGVGAGATATLAFKASYDIEPDWDYLIVEARRPGQDDWTTLPDPDHTTQSTGDSCPEGWIADLHPFLAHYQTDGSCLPEGTLGSPPGEWNGATGRSPGWEQWNVDLSDFAGGPVELSISYVSDYGFQGLGVFLDDIEVTPTSAGGTTSFEDDGDAFDGWEVSGAPAGSDANPNDWEVSESVGFQEGAVVSTDDSLTFGFGFEGIRTAAQRNEVLGRSIDYLLGSP